jgi:hypothetical protein
MLCITNIEKNEMMILDSACNYKLKDYSIRADSLICITEDDKKMYFDITNISHLVIEKGGFKNKLNANNISSYLYNEYELKEIDYNIILCSELQKKWEIINTKAGRKIECNSTNPDINRMLTIFAHPTLSNKGDFFIYNHEKWNWVSATYKTFEVDMKTGKQVKLFNGLNIKISPTDRYLLFNDLKKRHFIYDRVTKKKYSITATSVFWLYR